MSKIVIHKHKARKRRCIKTRARIADSGRPRLCVHRSLNHIYAQIIDDKASRVLLAVSTVDKQVKSQLDGKTGNLAAATVVGQLLAERAKQSGVVQVAFDRSGCRYHGRIKALADAAREAGMEF